MTIHKKEMNESVNVSNFGRRANGRNPKTRNDGQRLAMASQPFKDPKIYWFRGEGLRKGLTAGLNRCILELWIKVFTISLVNH